MFTWICPKCGKEVPPHENECPYCHGTGKVVEPATEAPPPPQYQPPAAPPHPPQPQAPPPPPHQQYTPPAAPPPPHQQYAPPQSPPPPQQQYVPPAPPPPQQQGYAAPPVGPPPGEQYYEIGGGQRKGLPGWLVMLLVAAVVVGIGYVLYTYVLPSSQSPSVAGGESPFEEVGEATPSAEALRIARHIEATGFRISEDSQQRAQAQFLIVNHSAADIGNLAGFVVLRLKDGGPDEPPISQVEFKTEKLGPYESIEFKTVIQTDLRAYEMPDWQFLQADVEITSPAGE